MIKINLHDYREEVKRSTIQKHVLMSASLVMMSVFLILMSFMYEKSRISTVDVEVRNLKQQVNALQGQFHHARRIGHGTGLDAGPRFSIPKSVSRQSNKDAGGLMQGVGGKIRPVDHLPRRRRTQARPAASRIASASMPQSR